MIANQTYQIGAQTLNITFDEFRVVPSPALPLISSFSAYVASPQSVFEGTYFNLTSSNLTQTSDLDWISIGLEDNMILVKSSDQSLAGWYTIVVVQNFNGYPDITPFATFKLEITGSPVNIPAVVKKPPYFDPPFVTQNISTCLGVPEKLWTFQAGKVIDPNNGTVQILTKMDFALFGFDVTTNTIS